VNAPENRLLHYVVEALLANSIVFVHTILSKYLSDPTAIFGCNELRVQTRRALLRQALFRGDFS
jgi:hypothetical protein